MLGTSALARGQGRENTLPLAFQLAFDLTVLQGTDGARWLSVRWPDSPPALDLQLWDPGLIPQVLVRGIDLRPGNRWSVRVSYSPKILSFLRLQTLWEKVKKIALRGRMPHGIKNGLKIKVKLYSCFLFFFACSLFYTRDLIISYKNMPFSSGFLQIIFLRRGFDVTFWRIQILKQMQLLLPYWLKGGKWAF